MLIKLVQGKTVDIADSVDTLDFSGLSGSCPWEVYVIWNEREECIARVNWEPSGAYQVWEDPSNLSRGGGSVQVTFRQDCIVPDVKRRLRGLFQRGLIGQVYRQQPCVLVQPMG